MIDAISHVVRSVPKVCQLYTVIINEKVRWANISVHIAQLMNLSESVEHLLVHHMGLQTSFLLLKVPLNVLLDVLELVVSHGQNVGTKELHYVYDVRVLLSDLLEVDLFVVEALAPTCAVELDGELVARVRILVETHDDGPDGVYVLHVLVLHVIVLDNWRRGEAFTFHINYYRAKRRCPL